MGKRATSADFSHVRGFGKSLDFADEREWHRFLPVFLAVSTEKEIISFSVRCRTPTPSLPPAHILRCLYNALCAIFSDVAPMWLLPYPLDTRPIQVRLNAVGNLLGDFLVAAEKAVAGSSNVVDVVNRPPTVAAARSSA